jgi:hypothetical protein
MKLPLPRILNPLRGALRQYRSSHTLAAWLKGTALALLVLGIYVLWVRWQSALNAHLRRSSCRCGRA